MALYTLSKTYPQKRAFITGAASGLGKALCLLLSKDGWTIGISDINEEALAETTRLITEQGGRAISFHLDVADHEQYREVAARFLAETKGIDLLINNAGVGDGSVFGEYSLENWHWMIGINQMGVIYGCHHFVPVMKQAKSGHIVNIASAAAFVPSPNMAAYNVTKAAVRALSETLRMELTPSNIKVSVVMPTFFKTNIMQYSRSDEEMKAAAVKMMEKSGKEASDIAHEVLVKAGKGKLNIILPGQARFLYFMRRFFPSLFYRLIMDMAKKALSQRGTEIRKGADVSI